VIARLFRKGAVAFIGNIRFGCAQQELQRNEFWNGLLAGKTVGQAHRKAINSTLVTVMDYEQEAGGSFYYQLQIRAQFGDPAFSAYVPSHGINEAAFTSFRNDKVVVHSPEKWWVKKMRVPEDWKLWTNRDLFVLRGAGFYSRRAWNNSEMRDEEETWITAEFTTTKQVETIEQITPLAEPLGWKEKWYPDFNSDGSITYRWAVRLVDLDQMNGKIINKVDHIDYKVLWKN
jgi:hypothetical protein